MIYFAAHGPLSDSEVLLLPCLSENEVMSFLSGRLSDAELRAVEAHADACPSCRLVLAAFGTPHDDAAAGAAGSPGAAGSDATEGGSPVRPRAHGRAQLS